MSNSDMYNDLTFMINQMTSLLSDIEKDKYVWIKGDKWKNDMFFSLQLTKPTKGLNDRINENIKKYNIKNINDRINKAIENRNKYR